MADIKVSVIIPTYRPKDYLWTCLDSIVNQTIGKDKYEVLLVLNGCKEPYETAIQEYLKQNQSVQLRYLQTDEGGVSNARNLGIEKAKGEYIAFIDDDDFVSPDYLKELCRVSSQDTIGLSYPFAFNDGEETVQLKNRITDEYEKRQGAGKVAFYRTRKFFSGPCMKMIHRSIVEDRRFDKRFKNGEDTLFMFKISDKIKYVSFASRNCVYYRRFRSDSATSSKRSFRTKVRDNIMGLKAYSSIYFSNIRGYRFNFFLTRVLGAIRGMVV